MGVNTNPYGMSLDSGGSTLFSSTNSQGAMNGPALGASSCFSAVAGKTSAIRYQIEWNSIETAVSTTTNTVIAGTGSQTITPVVMLAGFVVGNIMRVNDGNKTKQETATITATTGTTVTAVFHNVQVAGVSLSAAQPGDTPASAPTRVNPYTWTLVDDLVTTSQLVANQFDIVFVLQNAPYWHQVANACNATSFVPVAADSGTFIDILIRRYAPGTFYAIESGNEGFDASTTCTSNALFTQMFNLLSAVKTKVNAYSPTTLLGAPAQLHKAIGYQLSWIQAFYANNCHTLCDYINLHYYNGNFGSDQPQTGDYSLLQELANMRATSLTNNDASKQIWITETGWTLLKNNNGGVADATLAGYITTELTNVKALGYVQKLFFYGLNNLAPGNNQNQNFCTLSYLAWNNFIQNNLQWTSGPSVTVSGASRRSGTGVSSGVRRDGRGLFTQRRG